MKSLNNEILIINSRTKLIIKSKGLKNINDHLINFDTSKALLIVDKYIYNNKLKLNYVETCLKIINFKKIIYNSFYEPDFKALEEIKSQVNFKPSLIISIGGGSTLDIGKALSITLNFKGDPRKLQGQDKFNFQPIDQISVPTIFGSGAELTSSAVFINEKKQIKGGINSEHIRPKMAILDPYLSQSKDKNRIAECAFDSLVHSLESFTSKISNEFTKTMSILGVKNILIGLNLLKKNSLNAYEYLAIGSSYSINALMHSEQNFSGALSYQLAVHHRFGHAQCGANFLPYSIKLALSKKKNIYDELINNLFKNKIIKKNNPKELINILLNHFNYFKIKNIILTDDETKKIVELTYVMPMLNYVPFKFTRKEIKNILEKK